MFKNAIIFKTGGLWSQDLVDMEVALGTNVFTPCEPYQYHRCGWVPPRGFEHGALVESIAGQRILCLQFETKSVPSATVKRHLDERVAKIEREEGRKPGRRETRDLKDEIERSLLPHAFPKTTRVLVWFDFENQRLIVDTSSQTRADEVITELVRAFPQIQITGLIPTQDPQGAMTVWLCSLPADWPEPFSASRFVELHDDSETGATVKFDRHHLDDAEMRHHIEQGKFPTKLGMDWDGRVSFVLTDAMRLRKIKLLDASLNDRNDDYDDSFDGDVALATGELQRLINDLIAALGGEYN